MGVLCAAGCDCNKPEKNKSGKCGVALQVVDEVHEGLSFKQKNVSEEVFFIDRVGVCNGFAVLADGVSEFFSASRCGLDDGGDACEALCTSTLHFLILCVWLMKT